MHNTIPKAINTRGYIKFTIAKSQGKVGFDVVLIAFKVVEEITREAQVDSAKDPNKSALIPATSPTLSPTLSAMVAGFLGLSSGSPD